MFLETVCWMLVLVWIILIVSLWIVYVYYLEALVVLFEVFCMVGFLV